MATNNEEFDLSSEEDVPDVGDRFGLSSLMKNLLPDSEDVVMTSDPPLERATRGSAGYDFKSTVNANIAPGYTACIDTGVRLHIPPGYYMQLYTRSSIAMRNKSTSGSGLLYSTNSVLTLAGVLDSDYTGTIGIIMHNLGDTPYSIKVGDKIAQGIIHKYHTFSNEIVLKDDSFAHEGFGSTDTAVDTVRNN